MTAILEKTLYVAQTRTTGGRDGRGKSSDGELDVRLSPPGSGRPGTNPEQLLAVGWSACFIGALRRAGQSLAISLPDDVAVAADISLGNTADGGFALAAKLTVELPGLATEDKARLVDAAHQLCPYSKATRGNIAVTFDIP
ncbi:MULTISPECIES: organic hydroperoxide resistance protein [Pseudomonas]|uniref:organic hydroperoxide resistance protein n=1 Tax=Pseudomonadaceae TaxID=135621 RepID=UPI0010F663E3|nr:MULTISPECIES: organic hydroperoxide resistance protein [Pseudomonas]MDE3738855.1 organic hydroperoxide resistance protein [Pseudomonas resinovorans]